MTKADDSSLDPNDRCAVEEHARKLLDRAAAWNRFPTPIDDILEAANVKVAPTNVFSAEAILSYITNKSADAARFVKSAISKVFGIYDSLDNLIHIDSTVGASKQNFLKLHETGHHHLPTHRKVFRFFQDCGKTLEPEIADQFEREANNFARFALFQGNGYASCAADCALEIKTPMKLAGKFGASIYASAREFARTNHRACVVYVLERIEFAEGSGARAAVRRIETSPSYRAQFGIPQDTAIDLDHPLGKLLPIGRKMTRPTSLAINDLNGIAHECVAEAFDTSWNVIILMYPKADLTATTIIVPASYKELTSAK